MAEDELRALRQATRGLLYPSESDEPIEVFAWDTKEPDARSAVMARAGRNKKIEEQTLDDFFGELESSDEADLFKEVHQIILNTLSGVRVLRVGEVQVQIYLIGKTGSGLWGGLHTVSIET
jgi:hypothetical protein